MNCLATAFLAISSPQAPRVPPSEPPPAQARTENAGLEALRRDARKVLWTSKDGSEVPVRSGDETGAPPTGMLEAVATIQDRDYPRALAALYDVLDARPDYPPALYEMGVVYFRLQRYGDGAAALERYLAVQPDAVGQTRALGHCYYSLGDYARAQSHYELVLASAPREAEAWRGLALSRMHLGDSKGALDGLERVLEIEPGHADAWAWKAELLFDSDRSKEALAAAQKSRDLDPWQPRAWFLLGRIFLELGRDEEGLAAQARYRELSRAAEEARTIESRLEYGPHDVAALVRLVEIHRSTGNARAARSALARLTRERPSDVQLGILALDVLEGLGDAEGARGAANALKQRCSGEWTAWRRLEQYFGRTGERLEQLQAGEKARRLRSD